MRVPCFAGCFERNPKDTGLILGVGLCVLKLPQHGLWFLFGFPPNPFSGGNQSGMHPQLRVSAISRAASLASFDNSASTFW